MKIIVAGSRDITDYETVKKAIELFVEEHQPTSVAIVSGGARGVDRLAKQYAKEQNLPFHEYLADWDKYGKRAGYLRNIKMAENADALLAIWDGKSRGTQHMIARAKLHHLLVKVHNYERNY